ncbi:MAG: hypothetical protein ACOC57_04875 [Acidobacteriota bacterium]
MDKDRESLYKKIMEESKQQLETIDEDIEKEIQKAREILAKLQDSKKAYRQIYEGAARILGLDVEIEEDKPTHVEESPPISQDNQQEINNAANKEEGEQKEEHKDL